MRATDFGLSRFFKEGEPLSEVVGSPYYVSHIIPYLETSYWSCFCLENYSTFMDKLL